MKKDDVTFVLIGHPVAHSLSPAIHRAAYTELGLDGHRYVAIDCPEASDVEAELDAIRRGDLAGANVTVPWKRVALDRADIVDPSAAATGAANVIRPTGANGSCRLVAHNTDVPALAEELRRGRPGARTATVIGSGGAALAAVVACRSIGVERVSVVARRFRGEPSTWPGAAALAERGASPLAWPDDPRAAAALHAALVASDLVVQSTSDGMSGATDGTAVRDLVPFAELDRAAFAYDVVYNPAITPFVARARASGVRAESGLGMLVGQAALAIELWLGKRPDSAVLRAAAEEALAAKMRA
ncbi:MAG TPA: shikimate dehydrogenase [Polyangiaceae bacterium]|nr:shikimate dehydrogenase [Polyangiaceae bacterium]